VDSETRGHLYRFALVPGAIATLAMGVMFVAAIVWGISLRTYAPELFAGEEGILAMSTALT
jgi:hypothetical protein